MVNPAQASKSPSTSASAHIPLPTLRDDGMAPSEPTTQALSIHDIAALSDAELDLFLEKNRRPEGGFELEVDWTELPNGQRDIFAQRLR